MMSASIQIALEMYREHRDQLAHRTLEDDIRLALLGGVVVCTPDVLVLARAVHHDAPTDSYFDFSFEQEDPDCWFVWLAVACNGQTAADLLDFMPYELPKIAFYRIRSQSRRLHVHATARLRERAQRYQKRSNN